MIVRPRHGGRVLGAIAAVCVVFLISAGIGSSQFQDGPLTPDEWDPRVTDIVDFVEEHRGHDFQHPVRVYFLSDERYREVAGGGEAIGDPTPEDLAVAEQGVATFRALGLMEGPVDLLEANEQLQDAGTLAFYSPDDQVVNVRGSEMTPALRVTLAHELTHALQDQYFDLSAIADAETEDESGAARAVVEGDAVSVENAYIDELSDEDREAYDRESEASYDDAEAGLGEVPDVLQVLFGSYYAVGSAFVDYWQTSDDGEQDPTAVDALLRSLPSSSAQLFVPDDVGTDPEWVDYPEYPDDAEVLGQSTLGVGQLFVMLAERIDPAVALRATDGWTGDTYLAWIDGDTQCVGARLRFATDGDAEEFRSAIATWGDEMPVDAAVTVEADGVEVTFRSCDPGPDADMGLTGRAGDALALPVTRLQAAAQARGEGWGDERAWCYGTTIVEHLTLEDLQAEERTPAIDEAIAAAEDAC